MGENLDRLAVLVDANASKHVEMVELGRECIELVNSLPEPHDVEAMLYGHNVLLSQAIAIQAFAEQCPNPRKSTLYQGRRGIVPASPAMLRLGELLAKTHQQLESSSVRLCDPVHPENRLRSRGMTADRRRYRAKIPDAAEITEYDLLRGQLDVARQSLADVTDTYGGPTSWVKHPHIQMCDMLLEALERGDQDAEDFLEWFLKINSSAGRNSPRTSLMCCGQGAENGRRRK